MADYTPPATPDVDFVFKGGTFVSPTTPDVDFIFGQEDEDGPETGLLRSNYMILLTL